ncbi:MAG: MBL fold metallo-hydrolase [Chloroflexi bacterium]|nr:MAG: MBL fold metallo-hydrolase [Chloroflexota bacterium]
MSAWESSVSYAALPVSESPTVLGKVPQAFSSGPGQALPERAELMPGIWRLPLPLRDSPLGHVNTYLVRTDDGYLLVDCGWDTADTLRALEGHLRALDIRLPDVRHLVITHIHPDHYGLAGRLREISSADLSFHRLERLYIESRYVDADELLSEMREWLRLNGTPPDELDRLNRGSVSMMERVQIAFPDRTLDGGEEITCGRYAFRVIWTPGHSAGHICLYDARNKVLLSGDHVLPHITPSVGLHVRTTSNPLADYLDSLQLIGRLSPSAGCQRGPTNCSRTTSGGSTKSSSCCRGDPAWR